MFSYHQKNQLHVTDVTLQVASLKASIDFYRNLLGLTLINQTADTAFLGTSLTTLVILKENKNALTHSKLGLYHFALLLPSKADLSDILKHIIKEKYPITGASDHGVSEALYLNDLDGNGIELYYDRLESEWPKDANGGITMFTEAMDLESMFASSTNHTFEHIAQNTIMGHLHLHVDTLKHGDYFYREILGFQPVLTYYGSALFISDQKYHHHMGLNIWQKGSMRQPDESGLIGFSLNVPISQYDALIKRLEANQVTIYEDEKPYIIDFLGQKIALVVA